MYNSHIYGVQAVERCHYMKGLKISPQLPSGERTGWLSSDTGTSRGEVRVAGMGEGALDMERNRLPWKTI